MFRLFALPAILLSAVSSSPQEHAPATPPTSTYSNAQLGIQFTYPAALVKRDPDKALEAGHMKHFGASGDSDPEHLQVKKCIHVFTLLGTADGPEKEGVTPIPSASAQAPPNHPAESATFFLAEFDQACLTSQQKAQGENILGGLAQSILQSPDLKPIDQPIWYEIGKQKIHMAVACGQAQHDPQSEPYGIILMTFATNWNGHLLLWLFESSSVSLMNQLAHGQVTFGQQTAAPLFPYKLGDGPPMQPAP